MGKGDRKSKRGKIQSGTYGKRRPSRLKRISGNPPNRRNKPARKD